MATHKFPARPERPSGRPAGFQRWRRLLFLHWPVDPQMIQATLPANLEVDTFEGQAYVGVVAFTMRDVVPWWSPPIPGISDFHELNVRTYVRRPKGTALDEHANERGVWFYSLDAAGSVAVMVARLGWSLPYFRAAMKMDVDGDRVRYGSVRQWPEPKDAHFAASYRIGDALPAPKPGTLDHFLIEQYGLFSQRPSGALAYGLVHHRPYPLRDVTLDAIDHDLLRPAGLEGISGPPTLVHYSPGVDVDVFDLKPRPVVTPSK